jgi:hypothetical protein
MIAALDFEKPFPFGAIRVPPVRLKGGRLYYRPQGQLPFASGRPDRLVFDFARLATALEQAFLEFAQQWGVLGLCPHDKSIHHLVSPCFPNWMGDEMTEPISRWRRRARQVQAMLHVRAALNRGKPGEVRDWQVFWPGVVPTAIQQKRPAILGLSPACY